MAEFDNAALNVPAIWAANAQTFSTKTALVCGETSLTWGEVGARMNAIAGTMLTQKLRKGDRVAILGTSCVETVLLMMAIPKAGGVLVPVSGMLGADQLRTLLLDARPTMMFVAQAYRHLVDELRSQLDWMEDGDFIGIDFHDIGWRPLAPMFDGPQHVGAAATVGTDDPFSIIYSSGTTGTPKGVIHTHGARYYFCMSNAVEFNVDDSTISLVSTGLYTTGTWLMLMPPLFTGGTVHILPSFSVDVFTQTVDRHAITHAFVVPSQIAMLLEHDPGFPAALPTLRTLLSAGSPLRPDLKDRLLANGDCLYELYGCTEGISTVLKPAMQRVKPRSVGRPLIGQRMMIVDDEGTPVAPGTAGEIVGWGPGCLRTYNGNPQATQAAMWRDDVGAKFVRSGDVGCLDEDGYVYILDRKKDMIISGGLNIYPADLEAVTALHPAVQDVSVIGIDHEKWGETPVAYVVPRCNDVPPEDILSWTNARLAKHQRMSLVLFCESLPRNALGKVLKRELRDRFNASA